MYARYMVKDAIKFAFKRLLGFWLSFIPRLVITFIVTGVISSVVVFGLYYITTMLNLIPAEWQEFAWVYTFIIALIPPAISINIVLLRVALSKATGQPVPLWVTPIIRPVFKIFIAGIVSLFLSALGTAALVVPGIFISIRLFFAQFCIIDHGHGPLQSLKCSWSMTRAAKSDIWKLSFIIFGFILLGVGVWVWMGMPKTPMLNLPGSLPTINSIVAAKISWKQHIYTFIKIVMASLVILFIASLYVKLSQKEN